MGEVCRHFQFGFCKYLEKCRKFHNKEVCELENCSIDTCLKRHPVPCRYFQTFKRCKFGEYCYYSHCERKEDHEDVKIKFDELKCLVNKQDMEIKSLQLKLFTLEESKSKLELDWKKDIQEIITEVTVKITEKVMAAILPLVSKLQDDAQKRNEGFDLLSNEVLSLSKILRQPSKQDTLSNSTTPRNKPKNGTKTASPNT